MNRTLGNRVKTPLSKIQNIQIVIPAFQPDEKLLSVITALRERAGIMQIIVVDDGSGEAYAGYFDLAENVYGCHILRHKVNCGKGRALKTAFEHVINTLPDSLGVITVDADGQHAAEDVLACALELTLHPDSLILGSRDFDVPGVPMKSKFGNKLTRRVMKLLHGLDITDTQTGLRALPRSFLPALLKVSGERYEYELNMLLASSEQAVPLREVPIHTIYLEGNRSSHFNPFLDSIRIYAVFAKFGLSSLCSAVLDIGLFAILVTLFRDLAPEFYILAATVLARTVSSLFNYLANKMIVFRANGCRKTVIKYYLLAIAQMLVSAILVKYLFERLDVPGEALVKAAVDTILFFFSYQIQRFWIFPPAGRRGVER